MEAIKVIWNNFWEVLPTLASALVVVQLFLLKRQMTNDHARSRRENTVKVMLDYSLALKEETNVAEAIVQQLNMDCCRKLYQRIPFEISDELFEMLRGICPNPPEKTEKGACLVTGESLNILRWYVMSYLNVLETTLMAWKLNIVERDVIEQQFECLCDIAANRDFLSNLRQVANGYPVIQEFEETLIAKKRAQEKGRPFAPLFAKKKS